MARETKSTCPYCGVGCGVVIESDGDQITGVRGDPDHPANFGRLCSKGSTLHLTASAPITHQARLLHPMRRAHRGERPTRVSWDEAMGVAVETFVRTIREHGPDAVGFYLSGQLLTEDYYVFNKLAKGLIGTNNVDTNSRLCMSSAVAGYKMTLGADAPPNCYEDIDHAQCIFIAGSNTAWAHPVLFRRIEDAKAANPSLKIICCDPRRTETAGIADLYLPIQPGTDVMLLHGMLHVMLWEGWVNYAYIAAHTTGFDELKNTVRECTPDLVAQTCGIRKEDLFKATAMFATSATTLSLYCQGLNQSSSGAAKNAALINLHLATAQIGKPGAGPFSLTGQPNAMGGREVGGMANLLSAHRDLADPAHRAEVAALWGVPTVPDKPGKTAVEMFQAAADGQIKALWIACTNPAQSMPDQATVRRALERAEFVVVQEAFATTATCEFADLLLPATTWGEKTGTVTNSERRVSRVRPAIAKPGGTRHDWAIAAEFGHRLEKKLRPGLATLFPYSLADEELGAQAVWNEHRESTRGRDLDITGMSYALLDDTPLQWPMRAGESQGKARLYEDGVFPTDDGKARFANVAYRPLAEVRESRYPFSLNTGRLRDQWHGMSRTGTIGRLFGHVAEPSVQMHPQDLLRLRLADGDLVQVTSKRGSIVVPVQASGEVALSQAFIAMHWGPEFLGGCSSTGQRLAGVNALTTSAYCPSSKQPELKHAAVKIIKAELPWSLLGAAWLPDDDALRARAELQQVMRMLPFASCVPFGRDRAGVLFRAAAHEAPDDELIARIEQLLGLASPDTMRYADRRKGQRRAMRLVRHGNDAHLDAFLLAGDTSAQAWIKTLLQDELPAQSYGRMLLVPGATAPVAVAPRGKQVCTCFNVTDAEIANQLAAVAGSDDTRLAAVQSALKCGTSCGSCMPELKRMVRAVAPQDSSFAK
ncbi:nitrate reductase [Caenimonas koreensis]|uniref:Molybdopterin-dependent oxidoreductase n=1 Tax=Caenimonas koreensis DSM 17982 TaxID=1121255 RepID=A0A844AZJ9_9BURK|nr:nitrate reductase [Caenimonas koreensis]MRD47848.1 molybdopterin-dependent oxidoreductase [Caenimonas koreensis DSM 17982]